MNIQNRICPISVHFVEVHMQRYSVPIESTLFTAAFWKSVYLYNQVQTNSNDSKHNVQNYGSTSISPHNLYKNAYLFSRSFLNTVSTKHSYKLLVCYTFSTKPLMTPWWFNRHHFSHQHPLPTPHPRHFHPLPPGLFLRRILKCADTRAQYC